MDVSKGPLEWPIADYSRSMHVSGIKVVVVWLGRMHGASIVPEDEIMEPPFVPIDELQLHAVFRQIGQQIFRFIVVNTQDT